MADSRRPAAASPFPAPPPPRAVRDVGPADEKAFVHDVYEAIAPHFSQTRYKPWPVVDEFLKSRRRGELGADVGCGNGKYMAVNPDVLCVGSDRSLNLSKICAGRGYEAMVADTLHLPYRSAIFDFVVSIAVIHHLTTSERRKASIKELLRVLRPGGELMIFVWAVEQKGRRNFDPNEQDFVVPWALSPQHRVVPQKPDSGSPLPSEGVFGDDRQASQVFQRYYHLFREGELPQLAEQAAREIPGMSAAVTRVGYDKDNWYVIIKRGSTP